MAEPYYTDATALNAELGTSLTAPQALPFILDAEAEIDRLLGAVPVDTSTGRKVVQANVDAWQWVKLQRATVKLAAAIYRSPGLLTDARWQSVSGPDFSFSGPLSGAVSGVGRDVLNELNQSGLRRLSTRARSRGSKYDGFFAATRHDGT